MDKSINIYMNKETLSDIQSGNRQDNTIDFLKFIFAIFIVGIHTEILGNGESFISWFLVHWLFRIAVPFFFVVSGYYLGKKIWNASDKEIKDIFKNYRYRLCLPFLMWGGIGMLRQSISMYRRGTGIWKIILHDIQTAIFYPQGAMWFVWACIVASFIIQAFLKHKKLMLLSIAVIMGYFFALICNTYYFVIEGTKLKDIVDGYMYYCISARNGIFVGALFILEGMALALDKVQSLFRKSAGWKCWIVFGILELFFICEICLSYKKAFIDDSSLFIIFPVLIPVIVLLAVRYCMKVDLPYRVFRNLSTSIYFMHRFVLAVVLRFISSEFITFTCVIFITITIGLILQKINKPFLNKFVT